MTDFMMGQWYLVLQLVVGLLGFIIIEYVIGKLIK